MSGAIRVGRSLSTSMRMSAKPEVGAIADCPQHRNRTGGMGNVRAGLDLGLEEVACPRLVALDIWRRNEKWVTSSETAAGTSVFHQRTIHPMSWKLRFVTGPLGPSTHDPGARHALSCGASVRTHALYACLVREAEGESRAPSIQPGAKSLQLAMRMLGRTGSLSGASVGNVTTLSSVTSRPRRR